MHEAPPPSGVPALLANHRPPHPAETRSPPRARQLCHPQACQGDGMARQAPALSPALHPDLGIVAQPSRALLRLDHSSPHPARCLHLGARTRSGHPRLPRPSQCPPQALRLDKIGRGNPCQSQPRASHPGNRRERESSDKLSTLAAHLTKSTGAVTISTTPRPGPAFGRAAADDSAFVPPCRQKLCEKTNSRKTRAAGTGAKFCWSDGLSRKTPQYPVSGTDGSNPSPSSAESGLQSYALPDGNLINRRSCHCYNWR